MYQEKFSIRTCTLRTGSYDLLSLFQDVLLADQEKLYESFMGEFGDYLVFEIIADANKNVTLKFLDIEACTEPPKGRVIYTNRPRGYKTFFMPNSVEHEILNAHK